MTGLRRFLLPLSLIGLLAGCCANNVCNCQDERADAFFFRFDTGPAGFVPQTELDTVLLKRFALPLNAVGLPAFVKTHFTSFTDYADSLSTAGSYDLVTMVRSTALRANAVQTDTVVINNNLPFTQSGSRKLNTYLYRIEVRSAPGLVLKANPRRYELKKINIRGEFDGTGCCTCYRNTLKMATLTELLPVRGVDMSVVGTEAAPNSPVYITITK